MQPICFIVLFVYTSGAIIAMDVLKDAADNMINKVTNLPPLRGYNDNVAFKVITVNNCISSLYYGRCTNNKFSLCGSSELTSGRFLEVELNKP